MVIVLTRCVLLINNRLLKCSFTIMGFIWIWICMLIGKSLNENNDTHAAIPVVSGMINILLNGSACYPPLAFAASCMRLNTCTGWLSLLWLSNSIVCCTAADLLQHKMATHGDGYTVINKQNISKHATQCQRISPNTSRLSWPLCVVVQWCHLSTSSHHNPSSPTQTPISLKRSCQVSKKRYMWSIKSRLRVNVQCVSSR